VYQKIIVSIDGRPIPWKAPFVGSRGAFSPRYREMQLFQSLITDQYQGPVLEGAVLVDLIFYFKPPKAASKAKRKMMLDGLLRPTTIPDRTNLAKLYEDCLQGIVIKNDSQIVGGVIAKFYGEKDRTEIIVRSI
jgi:Holliday junction resolvase RusA-like endonuclease